MPDLTHELTLDSGGDVTEIDADTPEVDPEIASLGAAWKQLKRTLDPLSGTARAYLLQRAQRYYRVEDLLF